MTKRRFKRYPARRPGARDKYRYRLTLYGQALIEAADARAYALAIERAAGAGRSRAAGQYARTDALLTAAWAEACRRSKGAP